MKLKQPEVVIDTNVIISAAISKDNNPAKIFELLLLEAITNYTTQDILDEIINVFNRPKIRKLILDEDKTFIINKFKEKSKIIKPIIKLNIVKEDPSDDKFIECAITAKAKYIISGDPHLKNVKQYKDIKILSPREFIDLFE